MRSLEMSDPQPSSNLDANFVTSLLSIFHVSSFVLFPLIHFALSPPPPPPSPPLPLNAAWPRWMCSAVRRRKAESQSERGGQKVFCGRGRASCDLRFPRFIFKLSSLQHEFFRIVRSLTWNDLLLRYSIETGRDQGRSIGLTSHQT